MNAINTGDKFQKAQKEHADNDEDLGQIPELDESTIKKDGEKSSERPQKLVRFNDKDEVKEISKGKNQDDE